jgi:antitoxin MazE9
MKLSVSLPDEDVEFLDAYARAHGLTTRSSALQRAVRLLRDAELGGAYADAWEEWANSGEANVWEVTLGDGLPGR